MALFTSADRDSVKAALLALATGDRVVSVTVQGRTTTYQQADGPFLERLLSRIEADLQSSTGARRHMVIASGGKGLC